MDQFVARHFDLVVWSYTLEIGCLAFTIPRTICNALRIFNAGGISRYTYRKTEACENISCLQIHLYELEYINTPISEMLSYKHQIF